MQTFENPLEMVNSSSTADTLLFEAYEDSRPAKKSNLPPQSEYKLALIGSVGNSP